MKHLRQYIRQLLFEVYELDDEQRKRRNQLIDRYGYQYGSQLARAAGLDLARDQLEDRFLLQQYQEELNDPQGRKLKAAFMNGDVTILHSMTYQGSTMRMGLGGDKDKEAMASDWIKSFGKKGNATLSTSAYFGAPTESIKAKRLIGNAEFVISAKGLILKGYPVFVGTADLFSQTIGALDDKVKAHWKSSGTVKRPNKDNVIIGDDGSLRGITRLGRLRKVGFSGETLLDNWTVIGTYISDTNDRGFPRSQEELQAWIDDSLKMGLPCNVYGTDGKLIKRFEP